ncbi:MAG: hypothetical protein OXE44_10905 [Nitrospinae bacterium]|nr:hypothetical protein [Nitrospinota bacterium]
MKSIFKVFCAFTLIVLFQVLPAQSAGKDGTHQGGKSPVKSKEMSGITLQIAGGKIKGNKKVVRVKQGDEVKLNLMADKTTEVHLHGYDIEKTVSPGRVTVMAFQARVAGRFPVTEHGSHSHGKKKSGGHGEKVLFYLEVHP